MSEVEFARMNDGRIIWHSDREGFCVEGVTGYGRLSELVMQTEDLERKARYMREAVTIIRSRLAAERVGMLADPLLGYPIGTPPFGGGIPE